MYIYLLFDWFGGEIVLHLYFLFNLWMRDFHRLKRNMNDGTIVFMTSLLIALN